MSTLLRGFQRGLRPRRAARRPILETLDDRCLLNGGGMRPGYVQTALVSSVRGLARFTDPNLLNPWGFSETHNGRFLVSANGAGNAPLITAQGRVLGRPVILPTPSDVAPPSTPNGNITNTTSDFVIRHGYRSAPATTLFSTEDGTIIGWNPKVDKDQGVIAADLSDQGSIFKLLAMGQVGGANYLYATDFHNNAVVVFDKNFATHTFFAGQFTDPTTGADAIPDDFAPFGVKNINGTLFVSYAKQDADKEDDVAGVGNGFVDEYTLDGHFITRFATRGLLNSPIGMAVAPSNFGAFSNALLIGNFGDSHVNAFNMSTGQFLGQLTDPQGNPLVLNGGFQETDTKGLWGIGFGNGRGRAATNSLFFAAGINQENDGLFGVVTVAGKRHPLGFGPHLRWR